MSSSLPQKSIRAVKRLVATRQVNHAKTSFSQSGEDLIIGYLAKAIDMTKLSYLDIGAHHPEYISNTAIFYRAGSHGVNIEPDPVLFKAFQKQRPRDTNLNIGVGKRAGELTFYAMDVPALNSFVKSEIDKYLQKGHTLRETIKVPIKTIKQVVDEYCGGTFPDLLTIDVEGMDLDILKSIDYKSTAPTIICAETTTPSGTTYVKVPEVSTFLKTKGYMVYADTFINTIYVKAEKWQNVA